MELSNVDYKEVFSYKSYPNRYSQSENMVFVMEVKGGEFIYYAVNKAALISFQEKGLIQDKNDIIGKSAHQPGERGGLCCVLSQIYLLKASMIHNIFLPHLEDL